ALLELRLVFACRVDEDQDRDVVAFARLREELVGRPRRLDRRILAGGQDLPRLVLRRLHVRLVERVDAERRAGNRRRELPAEELLSELVLAAQLDPLRLAVRTVRRLAGSGNEALPELARRLGEPLLGPQS